MKNSCKQKESLIKIIDELGEKAKSIIMWAYFENENNTFNIMNLEDKEKHDYLNYYWCEYQMKMNNLKITMFYKDLTVDLQYMFYQERFRYGK